MKQKQIKALAITGMGLLAASIAVTTKTAFPDMAKGLVTGIAIGLLALSLILRTRQKAGM